MCDRDESWANLNTYQTCLNYRGKMRYKNYSSKGGVLETVHSIHSRKCKLPYPEPRFWFPNTLCYSRGMVKPFFCKT